MSERTDRISPFLVMEILERAAELRLRGEEVISLEVGEPDFPTPACIVEAGLEALQAGRTKYTSSLGLRELREAIAEHYRRTYGVTVSPEQIVVTPGSSPALLLTFAALLERGDEVLLPDPGYACYPNFVRFVDGVPRPFPVQAAEGYDYDLDRLRAACTPRTRVLLVNSPANPTGAVLPRETLARLPELGLWIVSDEIYHGLVYEGRAHSILEFTDRAFVLDGFSKRYAMTGWRLGYVIAPKEFVRALQKLAQNLFISASEFVQLAALAGLRAAGSEVARMVAEYDRRRRFLIPHLRELGLGVEREPTGAYYVLADARRFTTDSLRFARELLERAKVAVTPGIDFGRNAEGYLRFSYANSLENIAEGLRRLGEYLSHR
ncbi:MAG TPA: pyridoxal phosphate-dependent aminotransferase [Armatimonadetes bacterium]|nr:pyridoxal phosphate-dependent aminotransferase [Armatimonadota bacterium]